MKKFALSLVLAAVLALTLSACGGSGNAGSTDTSDTPAQSGSTAADPAATTPDAPAAPAKVTVPAQYYGTWEISWLGGTNFAELSEDVIRITVESVRSQRAFVFTFGADSNALEVNGVVYDLEIGTRGSDYTFWIEGDASEKDPLTGTFTEDGHLVVDLDHGTNIYTFEKTA